MERRNLALASVLVLALATSLIKKNQKPTEESKADEEDAGKLLERLYEKLYFHEIDTREKVTSRLQVPLAIGVAIVGLLGTMIQNVDRATNGAWAIAFWTVLVLAMLSVVVMGYFFYRSAWGQTYQYLPRALALDAYRRECEELYKGRDDCNELVLVAIKKALSERYLECASLNSEYNDLRSYDLFLLIRAMVVGIAFTFFAFFAFFMGSLDRNTAAKKPLEIKIIEPIQMKDTTMTTKPTVPPPPPPPAPPSRQVREDRTPNAPPKK